MKGSNASETFQLVTPDDICRVAGRKKDLSLVPLAGCVARQPEIRALPLRCDAMKRTPVNVKHTSVPSGCARSCPKVDRRGLACIFSSTRTRRCSAYPLLPPVGLAALRIMNIARRLLRLNEVRRAPLTDTALYDLAWKLLLAGRESGFESKKTAWPLAKFWTILPEDNNVSGEEAPK